MRVLIDIGHPAHVHLFKNIIRNLENDGHKVKIATRDKEITLYLLDAYGFEYENLGRHHKKLLSKLLGLITRDYKLYKVAKKFKPDIFISHGSICAAHVAKLVSKPHIALEDTENSTEQIRLYAPFTNAILTPSCFELDLGKKQRKYNGYTELTYLHPNYFKPDPAILDELGLNTSDKYIVLRFVSWSASHDIRDKGFTNKKEVIQSLERYGRILITSEAKLPPELEKYMITVAPEKIHHLLYFANLYLGESATMASESAILGTPAIFVSTSRRGYTDELETKYDMVYTFSDHRNAQNQALEKALELLKDNDTKRKWQEKRKKMLFEKIDVTKHVIDFIEEYPNSFLKPAQREVK
jgi:predicted glycosyltransferase